jgi:hypothetical protein
MSTPTRPFIDCEQQHASVFVSDLAAASTSTHRSSVSRWHSPGAIRRGLQRCCRISQHHGIDYDSHGSYRFIEGDA